MKYSKVAKQINDFAKNDQLLRNKIFSKSSISGKDKNALADFDKKSSDFIKNIVIEIGLPTITKVGKNASYNAWLLVQHSRDLEFQKSYLELLKQNEKDINPANIAYLEDRVLMYENKPQIFGTQFVLNQKTGKMEPYTISDPENVNERRSKYGMETVEEHLKKFYSV
ncbi:hypothetical protein A3K01_01575 [candidate division WWE3 bacterium RIFOXYD1_FULL_43_17]|uniref:Uncharacterized protein n=2 Tax=Katanobacteria TaxID=422282 RepID=A0A1F4XFP3_UNCKA|nr:MAG: hypothetical protein UU59_C0012G0003 [candidate division WWE3 bacterium GW2011_GWE1_41_27]OGC80507.1 MAG: hypothetical protein A3K01_01575 [candidate division WWE3 bacterium RIFOXYD1_FULL_43_17]